MKSDAKECCKAKGVSEMCMGLCRTEPDDTKSLQRNTACGHFHDRIEDCLSGKK